MSSPANKRPRRVHKDRVYRLMVAIGTLLFRLLNLRRQVHGAEHLPTDGGAVLAISHFSYLDFALVEWAVWRHRRRYTRFMATLASFEHPIGGPIMRAMGHIPVDRSKGASGYKYASEILTRGELVGVFPESRVSRSFQLLTFKNGAARLAEQSGTPIIPVVVWGSHRVITRSRSTQLRKARHTPVTISFGAPIRPAPGADPTVVTEQLRVAMLALLAQAQDTYPTKAEPGAWWVPSHRGGGAPDPAEAEAIDLIDYRRKVQA